MRILLISILSALALYFGGTAQGKLPPLAKFFSPNEGFWQNEIRESTTDLSIDIPGLKSSVKVVMDKKLVPHIYAQNLQDAYRVQGYLHAKYRLFQMDLTHRATLGRLSEVFGKRLLDYDKSQRRIGLPQAAERGYAVLKQDTQSLVLLQAYADGVNSYIDQLKPRDYPIEFKLLSYKPQPVSPFNTIVITISMAQVLSSWNEDIPITNNYTHLGRELFNDLFPLYNPKQTPVIPREESWDFRPVIEQDTSYSPATTIEDLYKPPYPKGIGSNNWVVAPKKSKTGSALLANDPHLNLTLPSIWYENHISTPTTNVYGVVFPGAPGVIIGFNDSIGWGITNVGQDVIDWYKIHWVDSTKMQYWIDGKKKDVELKVEAYDLKKAGRVLDTIRWTVWGPVITKNDVDLAMNWVIHNDIKSSTFKTFLMLNSARNYKEYREALSNFEAPAQNIIFASTSGDIALYPQGKYPLRKGPASRFVQDGSTAHPLLHRFIPSEHNPHSVNPAQGYLASANQRTTDRSYPYFYLGGFDQYRGRIINRFLRSKERLDIDDFIRFQNSNYSIFAEELLPLMLDYIDPSDLNSKQRAFYATLKDWNYSFDKDSRAAVLFDELYPILQDELWDEFEAIPFGKKPGKVMTIEILQKDQHPFIDHLQTDRKESAKDIALQSFLKMVDHYDQVDDIPPWSEVKKTKIAHLARLPGFSEYTDTGGYDEALNAQTTKAGPSWRMILDMTRPIEAYGVYPGGQSGHPGSYYYTDMLDEWASGKYFKLHNSPRAEEIEKLYNIHFSNNK